MLAFRAHKAIKSATVEICGVTLLRYEFIRRSVTAVLNCCDCNRGLKRLIYLNLERVVPSRKAGMARRRMGPCE